MPSCPETSCDHDSEWPCADPREQALLMLSGVAFIVSGARAVLRNRPRWFPVWLGGLLAWATIPKYFICARCENYDKPCDFFYGGKYAAKLFKKQDKPFNAAGYFAEGTSLAIFQFIPPIIARRDPKALVAYLLSAGIFQALLVKFCCIDCVRFARDPWKAKYCPTYKMVEKLNFWGSDPFLFSRCKIGTGTILHPPCFVKKNGEKVPDPRFSRG